MSKKIFVSYKHSDTNVQRLYPLISPTTRDYVDYLEQLLEGNHIYKGERDDEDIGHFKDEAIESHLRDKIYDSSVTIVLISKGMKDLSKVENDQWIPWEIAYSLKEKTRDGRTSGTNAMLGIVIPDETGSYSHVVNRYACMTQWSTDSMFKILGKNMFNRNEKNVVRCGQCSGIHHTGKDHSYIHPVKWDDFISNINYYVEHAISINQNIENYDLTKII